MPSYRSQRSEAFFQSNDCCKPTFDIYIYLYLYIYISVEYYYGTANFTSNNNNNGALVTVICHAIFSSLLVFTFASAIKAAVTTRDPNKNAS